MREQVIERIEKEKLIAIVRGLPEDKLLRVADALYEGGVRAIECPFDHRREDCVSYGAAMIALLIALCASTRPSPVFLLIAVGFASQYLPWVLVPRSTYIYHYFASVPFIIIATVLWIGRLRKVDSVAGNTLAVTLMALALFLFVAFYPLESGYPCAYSYALKLRWFNWYNFALQQ